MHAKGFILQGPGPAIVQQNNALTHAPQESKPAVVQLDMPKQSMQGQMEEHLMMQKGCI